MLYTKSPQYMFSFIKIPVFIANSLYDTAQLNGLLGLNCLPPNCSEDQMKFFDNFRNVKQICVNRKVVFLYCICVYRSSWSSCSQPCSQIPQECLQTHVWCTAKL